LRHALASSHLVSEAFIVLRVVQVVLGAVVVALIRRGSFIVLRHDDVAVPRLKIFWVVASLN
jgi:hypothetical protein